ncbi:SDR family oxidoreductase [Leucobacter tardus]|uniref:SDR family oxidoreductase n=1 Tax=Leucobacter tardus TaxID=501483 RepID=A0A939QLJ0_9MICO|nr:SDR family oxidoreductase [Leucobacter tardus]MBO2990111.1 SDR family oxidoreductase [Leucobacter tardus]
MARIIIIGGHGHIAQHLTTLLAEQGDQVTSVIRNPEQTTTVTDLGAQALVADIEQLGTAEIAALLAEHDAVVWSAGAGGGDPARTYAVDRDAAIRTIDAAEQAGVDRFVMVSYFGASADHGIDPENSFFAYAESKAQADEHLRASGLAWTVLGPSGLTHDEPTGAIDAAAAEASDVPRADVAAVIRAALVEPRSIRQTIRFNAGETSIGEALRTV